MIRVFSEDCDYWPHHVLSMALGNIHCGVFELQMSAILVNSLMMFLWLMSMNSEQYWFTCV